MLDSLSGTRPMRQRVRDARKWASTTPGRLRVLSLEIAAVALILVIVGSGTLITAMVTVNGIRAQTVPAVVSMQHVHAWLSDADRNVASAYLAGGFDFTVTQLQFDAESSATNLDELGRLNPDDPQQRYEADIAAASRELQKTTQQTADSDGSGRRLQAIAVSVANYIRLVNTAISAEKGDASAGTVYLQAASNLMHGPGGILAQVDDMRSTFVEDLSGANVTLQITLGLLALYAGVAGLLLVLLVRTQHFVRVRFRRRRNSRLLAATLLLVLVTAGAGLGTARAAGAIKTAEDQSYPQMLALWDARVLVYDASGNESLSLIMRGRSAQFDQAFDQDTARLVDRPLTEGMIDAAGRGDIRFEGLLADQLRSADSEEERQAAQQTLRSYQQFLGAVTDARAQADAATRAQADAAARAAAAARNNPKAPAPAAPTPTKISDQDLVSAVSELDWYLGASMQIRQDQFDATLGMAQLILGLTAGLEVLAVLIAALTFWGLQPRIDEYAV
ncbi:MAG TPA: hypothetical protein VIC57_00995 [Candidatus Dormibacteraeota bacterium]|jgi:hypothetical protein